MFQDNDNEVSTATPETEIEEVRELLQASLERTKVINKRTTIVGGALSAFIFIYLAWAYSWFSTMLEPEPLAQVITGVAVENIPPASKSLRQMVVDGAPNMARAASQQVVDLLPHYRQS